jgi:intracellular sulfur oxidation DsrE/DsrF family protein
MKKVTDLNTLKREDIEFFASGCKLTKFQLYSKTFLEIVNLVNSGILYYQEI